MLFDLNVSPCVDEPEPIGVEVEICDVNGQIQSQITQEFCADAEQWQTNGEVLWDAPHFEDGNIIEDLDDKVYDVEDLDDGRVQRDEPDARIDFNTIEGPDGVEELNLKDMCLDSMDQVESFYRSYAVERGFKARKIRSRRNADHFVTTVELCCNRQGCKNSKGRSTSRPKLTVRSGCLAMVRFKKQELDGKWKCVSHERHHNHPFVSSGMRHLLKNTKAMSKDEIGTILSLFSSGIRPIDTYRILSNEAGGPENCGVRSKTIYRIIAKSRAKIAATGDANSLLKEFKRHAKNDPDFYYSYQKDAMGRMTNFYWRDGQMKADYMIFGDFVSLDATYRTNKYNLFCVPLVGANHHRQTIVFGMAFIVELKARAFEWLLQTFLDSMDGVEPKTLFSDEEHGFVAAFDKVMKNARHRLCLWHIAEKVPVRLKKLSHQPGFTQLFMKCLYDCITEDQLVCTWNSLLEKYSCGADSWLTRLWSIRSRWALSLCREFFSAGTLATQRSESINAVMGSLANRRMGVLDLFMSFGIRMQEWRFREAERDFYDIGIRDTIIPNDLLIHASKVYTFRLFKDFKEQFEYAMGAKQELLTCEGSIETFRVSLGRRDKHEYTVSYDSTVQSVECSCKFFTQQGYLCAHAIRILDLKGLEEIPSQYILKRWAKDARSYSGSWPTHSVAEERCKRFCWRTTMIRDIMLLVDSCVNDPSRRKHCREAFDSVKESLIDPSSDIPEVLTNGALQDPKFVTANKFGSKRTKSIAEMSRSSKLRKRK